MKKPRSIESTAIRILQIWEELEETRECCRKSGQRGKQELGCGNGRQRQHWEHYRWGPVQDIMSCCGTGQFRGLKIKERGFRCSSGHSIPYCHTSSPKLSTSHSPTAARTKWFQSKPKRVLSQTENEDIGNGSMKHTAETANGNKITTGLYPHYQEYHTAFSQPVETCCHFILMMQSALCC